MAATAPRSTASARTAAVRRTGTRSGTSSTVATDSPTKGGLSDPDRGISQAATPRLMIANRVTLSALGTTGVLLAASLTMLALVSALVTFNAWPRRDVGPSP